MVATIKEAAELIKNRVLRTPTQFSPPLSDLTGAEVWLKLENLQVTGSFKARGALVKLSKLTPSLKKAGVVTASAGNHAQGVAYHSEKLGIPATIVMPTSTPFTKVTRTEAMGAKVILEGKTLDEATIKARQLERNDRLTYIHPYDDPDIYAGQGTLMKELLEDAPALDAVIAPIGGGGLISGCALALCGLELAPTLFGVQSTLYPSIVSAIEENHQPFGGRTIAEGIAVKRPGKLTLPIIRKHVKSVYQVDESALENAVHHLLSLQKIVVEGAGAAPLAALLNNLSTFRGKKVGLIVSGGNIDARILSAVLMRGLAREGRLARLRVAIPDNPGSLANATGVIGQCNGNIIEIHHRRLFYDVPVKTTEVDVIIETVDSRQLDIIVASLIKEGFPTSILKSTSESDPG